MRKALTVLICIFAIATGRAQEKDNDANAKITGKVIDSTSGLPIEYATITLYKPGDKKALNGATTNKDGNFTVTNVLTGDYTIIAESIGYLSLTIQNISAGQKRIVSLPAILLVKKNVSLENVTVTANAKLIDNKIDKLVYNAEKDLTSQTGVATDILKKVPQVSVDVDGNVELAGSTSIRFLINGKPSTVYGSSISDVLQSIPASEIKSIEVITNPGAKYDAQGLGGIINIILKKSTAQGINGNLSLTAGTRNENGSFNFNVRKGKFGLNAFFSGNLRPVATTIFSSQRLSVDSATIVDFSQDGKSRFRRHGFQSGLGFDWTIKEKNSLSGSLSFDDFGNSGNGAFNQLQTANDKQNPSMILSVINTINNTSNSYAEHQAAAEINYKRTFDREDQELEIKANTSFGRNHITSGNSQFLLPLDSLFYGTNSINSAKEKETEVQVDYTQPFSENVKLGVGGKFDFYDINSSSDVKRFQPVNGQFMYDPSLSVSLDYNQKVYALYAELGFPVAKILDAKIGGRYERTEINSFYSNASQQAATPGYDTWVPSLFFLKKLNDKQTLKASYSKRIGRPDYNDLNPFISTADPKNITAGNPYLKPEVSNRFELSYNNDLGKGGSFVITLFYRANHNDIQPFIVYYPSYKVGDSVYTNVSITTRENIGLEKNTGASLFGDLRLNSKLSLRSNIFLFYRHTINIIDKGYNSSNFNYRFNLNTSYQFSNTLVAEFFGSFNSPRHEAQGKYPSFTTYSFAIRKQFWDKKGSIALTAVNPFNKYVRQETNLYGPGFNLVAVRQIPFRSIGINFTWKFGRLIFKKEEESNKDNGNLNPPSEN